MCVDTMLRRKDLSNDADYLLRQFPISPGVNVPASSAPRLDPRATFQTLQASVSVLNVKFNDSTIRIRLSKYGLFKRFPRRKPLPSKMNMAAQLRFANLQ